MKIYPINTCKMLGLLSRPSGGRGGGGEGANSDEGTETLVL